MSKPFSKHQIETMETFVPEQRQELDDRKKTKSKRLEKEHIRLKKEYIRLKKETEKLEELHAKLLSRSLCSRCKGKSPCIEDAPVGEIHQISSVTGRSKKNRIPEEVQNLTSRSAHPSSSHMPSDI